MKPDPRIFDSLEGNGHRGGGCVVRRRHAGHRRRRRARAAGLRPFVMDPHGLHHDAGYDRVESLAELARLVRP